MEQEKIKISKLQKELDYYRNKYNLADKNNDEELCNLIMKVMRIIWEQINDLERKIWEIENAPFPEETPH